LKVGFKRGKKRARSRRRISRFDEWILMIIFVALLIFFIDLLSVPRAEDETIIALEKLTLNSQNANQKIAFIEGNSINEAKLESVSQLNYNQIKQELGTDKDFYLYLEDSRGRVVPIDGKLCLGSSKATVNGVKCS
jgi:lipopolysaccharide export LptBFGC system permease protein LptF